MNRHEAITELKKMEPTFLLTAKKIVNGHQTYICPKCGNGSGHDGDGIVLNPHSDNKRYKCFVCGLSEDIIGLWMQHNHLSNSKDAFNELYKYYNIIIDDFQAEKNQNDKSEKKKVYVENNLTDFFLRAHKNVHLTDYWAERGLSKATVKKFKLGFVDNWINPKTKPNQKKYPSPRLIIPVTENSYLARDTRKNIPDTQIKYAKIKVKNADRVSWVFNAKELVFADKPIFITEGELDAMSISEVGGAAVALGSVAYTNGFLDILKKNRPVQPLIIALDNESQPEKVQRIEKIASELENKINALKIDVYRIKPSEITGIYKDANEHLVNNRNAFKKCIENVYKRIRSGQLADNDNENTDYVCRSALDYLADFTDGIKESVNTPYIKTGFKQLDRVLDGGLYEGLYICGAISSVGKTTLLLQICDYIAMSGTDVMIFSLEMARNELMAKSISRHTLLEAVNNNGNIRNAKTVRGITCGSRYNDYSREEIGTINSSIQEYSRYADKIFIKEGNGNIGVNEIRNEIELHIKHTGRRPVVLIDYIQILKPADIRAAAKQNMDFAVSQLKIMSRDFKIPVIGISSFNRSNYNEAVAMEAFKESGGLEYGSDVLMGLQLKGTGAAGFDVNQAKQKNPREVELVVLKNRNGPAGCMVPFKYYSLFNYFEEQC